MSRNSRVLTRVIPALRHRAIKAGLQEMKLAVISPLARVQLAGCTCGVWLAISDVLNTPSTMENVYQPTAEVALPDQPEELTPLEQLRLQWSQQPGAIPVLKQKNVIDSHPELLPYAGIASLKGWLWPYGFAFQGLIIAAILASLLNWYITHDTGKLQDDIIRLRASTQEELKRQQGVMDATQAEIDRISRSPRETFNLRMADRVITKDEALAEMTTLLEDTRKSSEQYKRQMAAKEQDLRATQNAAAIARSGTPLLFALALLLAAGWVCRSIQHDYARNKLVRNSGDFFLYFATSEGIFLNLVFVFLWHFALSGANYGLSGLFESVGPLVWAFFWIGFYALVLRYFVGIARGMHKALQLRLPANEWSPENRMLLRIHNNFMGVFAVVEGTFLAACYLFYHADKHLF